MLVVVTHFWVPKKQNEKIQKISKKYSEEIQKIIGARKGCWNAEKMSKLVEEIQKFDNENLTDKENSI
jgi:Skp family chaperone for outer membrane proteins